jgi:[ribosomal protein S5]-alanine N-acetyltransferase
MTEQGPLTINPVRLVSAGRAKTINYKLPMFPELSSERFLLTQVQDSDLEFLFEGLGDEEAMPYNGVYFKTLEATKAQLEWYATHYKAGTGIYWKIVSKPTGESVGVISVYYYKKEHRKAELGYWLLPRFWKQGIASEVIPHIIDYWKKEKNLHRLEAFVEEENAASIALMEKLGFTHEGTMRECEWKFGRFIDLRIYAKILD